jgi:hypothetical protein
MVTKHIIPSYKYNIGIILFVNFKFQFSRSRRNNLSLLKLCNIIFCNTASYVLILLFVILFDRIICLLKNNANFSDELHIWLQ